TDAVCFGYNDGTAIITTNGGTSPYNTNWFGQNNLALTLGNYSTLITDANGCTNTLNFTISEPAEIQVTSTINSASCFGYSDGNVTLNIVGVAPPFLEDWLGQNSSALAAGTHNFTVTDNDGCVQQGTATISEPLDITTTEIISDVLCNGESNGTAFLQIFGGTSPYSENWNGVDITQLPKGIYNYTVTDANGCIFPDYVSINEPNPISVSESVSDANCFNSNDGQAILTISGGTSPYSEDWGTENPFSLSSGIYYYIVTDNNSCTFSDSVLINQSNQVFMSFSMESPICISDPSTMFINVVNPLSSNYTLEINDGTITSYLLIDSLGNDIISGKPFEFSPSITTLITMVSITDENGCNSPVNQVDSIIVNQLPILTLDIPNFCTQDSSQILTQGIPSGGTYFIDGMETNFFDIEKLEVETYQVDYEYTDPITNCFNTISTDVQINRSPIAEFAFGPQPADIDNPEVFFENKSDFYNYQLWTINDGTSIENQDAFSHIFSDTGNYITQLYIENIFGCSDSISNTLTIYPVFEIYIPSAFTPNNDGDNELFGPVLREKGYLNYTLFIYDRWGGLIFKGENSLWDGTLNDVMSQSGTYGYSIIAYDFLNKEHVRNGSFILIK
ncbi:MAG: T9SS type B sorting domain-containing protein, partial [Flavobacteriales bacterium]|nr:T9SS type B sorting domain-containing protein [Flavobacteriales bacterium]